MLGEAEILGLMLADGERDALGLLEADGLRLAEGEMESDGESEALGEELALGLRDGDGLSDEDAEAEGLRDALGEREADGLRLAEALLDGERLAEGLMLADGEVEIDAEADGLIEKLVADTAPGAVPYQSTPGRGPGWPSSYKKILSARLRAVLGRRDWSMRDITPDFQLLKVKYWGSGKFGLFRFLT